MAQVSDDSPPSGPLGLSQSRDRAIGVLTRRYADDTLSDQELDRRLELAERATTVAEIERLVFDLGGLQSAEHLPMRVASNVEARQKIVAVMGGVERRGVWSLARKTSLTTIMGGVALDLRQAVLGPGVTELQLNVWMGGVEITVPPGLPVEITCHPFLGGITQEQTHVPGDPDAPRLRISGVVVMGGVEVKERLPGESNWQARRRRKAEQKSLRAASQRALPRGH